MAKALFACYKKSKSIDFEKFGQVASMMLAPDNAIINEPYISYDDKTFSLIYNPTSSLKTKKHSLLLGLCNDLFEPGAEMPRGSFAIFRVRGDKVEIATDYSSSRTIWYFNDESKFIASTSQRLIISLLGDFQFNEKACGWFLSSGTLGPGHSWDCRLKMLTPRTALTLNRELWRVTINKCNENYNFDTGVAKVKDSNEYKNILKKNVKTAVENLKIDPSLWTLALSGGMDSRSLLYHLKDSKLTAVTWGLNRSMKYKDSDARIGKRLAKLCSMNHKYAEMDIKRVVFHCY